MENDKIQNAILNEALWIAADELKNFTGRSRTWTYDLLLSAAKKELKDAGFDLGRYK